VLVLPGGRVALLGRFSSMNDRFYERYRRLIVADRAGRIIARRTLRWSEDDRSAVHQVDEHMRLLSIAEIDGVVGVERVDPASRSHRFYPVDGSPSRELAALDPGALTVCRAARPRRRRRSASRTSTRACCAHTCGAAARRASRASSSAAGDFLPSESGPTPPPRRPASS
jgi:hypothetical protein